MNDEADCAGVFYDGDIGATISLDLPPRLAAAAPLALSRADYEAMPRVTELFERSMAPVAQVLARARVAAAEVGKMMVLPPPPPPPTLRLAQSRPVSACPLSD